MGNSNSLGGVEPEIDTDFDQISVRVGTVGVGTFAWGHGFS